MAKTWARAGKSDGHGRRCALERVLGERGRCSPVWRELQAACPEYFAAYANLAAVLLEARSARSQDAQSWSW